MTPVQRKALAVYEALPEEIQGVPKILHKTAGDAVTDLLVAMSDRVKTHRGIAGEHVIVRAVVVLIETGGLTLAQARVLTGKDFTPRQMSLL